MGHIRLSREADLVVVAPATADILAKMCHGLADDLATTALLATDKPVLVAPGMNVEMWNSAATRRNVARLRRDGVRFVGPDSGDLACGEVGAGRMAEASDIVAAIATRARRRRRPGDAAAGPQRPGHRRRHPRADRPGALHFQPLLGPAGLRHRPRVVAPRRAHHPGDRRDRARGAARGPCGAGGNGRRDAGGNAPRRCRSTWRCAAAAVGDWRVANRTEAKIKKTGRAPALDLVENPDILAALSRRGGDRPRLVIGFAAETDDLVANATAKLRRKGCDWVIANDVSGGAVFGEDENRVHVITGGGAEAWPRLGKDEVAERIAARVAAHLDAAQAAE